MSYDTTRMVITIASHSTGRQPRSIEASGSWSMVTALQIGAPFGITSIHL